MCTPHVIVKHRHSWKTRTTIMCVCTRVNAFRWDSFYVFDKIPLFIMMHKIRSLSLKNCLHMIQPIIHPRYYKRIYLHIPTCIFFVRFMIYIAFYDLWTTRMSNQVNNNNIGFCLSIYYFGGTHFLSSLENFRIFSNPSSHNKLVQ